MKVQVRVGLAVRLQAVQGSPFTTRQGSLAWRRRVLEQRHARGRGKARELFFVDGLADEGAQVGEGIPCSDYA